MKTRAILLTARVGIILTNVQIESLTRDMTDRYGRTLVEKIKAGNTRVGHLTTLSNLPRASSKCSINDNHSIQTGLLAGSKRTVVFLNTKNYRKDIGHSDTTVLSCRLYCCKSCTFCYRTITKERCKTRHCKLFSERNIKVCERCFLCRPTVFCQTCNKCPICL